MGSRKKVDKKVTSPKYLHHHHEVKKMATEKPKRRRRKKPLTEEEREQQEEMKIAVRFQKRTQRYLGKDLATVGVRFASEPGKEYTYLVPNTANLWLGMEVTVRNSCGHSRCAYITRIDGAQVILPNPEDYDDELKMIQGKVVPLV